MKPIVAQIVIPLFMYICVFVSGLIVSIAVGITKDNLNGNCPLYMDFREKRFNHFYLNPGQSSACDFVIYLPVITCVLYGFVMILVYLYAFFRVLSGNEDSLTMVKKQPEMLLNTLIFFLVFVAACIISSGRSTLCSNYMNLGFHADDCYNFERSKGEIHSLNTIHRISMAELTIWLCLIWWMTLILPTAFTFRPRKDTVPLE